MAGDSAEAQRLAEQEANHQAVAELVQQADEARSADDLEGAVSFYEQALEIFPEDEDLRQQMLEVQEEIEQIARQAAMDRLASAERQREIAEQREREEADRIRREEEERRRQRELEERRSRPDNMANPLQGTIRLSEGFTPDPWTHSIRVDPVIDLEEIDFYYGYTTSPPTVNLEYAAGSSKLEIIAESADDLVMLVYAPDGEWYFNDDYIGVDPGLFFENPQSGTYKIWVGGYDETESTAILTFSEIIETAATVSSEAPDFSATPINGTIRLESGFTPDPHTEPITMSGTYDLSQMGYAGYVSSAPNIDLFYVPGSFNLTIKAESDVDTVILINTPSGEWYYNDDFEGLDPGVLFENPEEGLYNIWVGPLSGGTGTATLIITEWD